MATNTFSDENSWEGSDEDEVQTGRGQKRKNKSDDESESEMNKASIIINLKVVKNTIPKNSV